MGHNLTLSQHQSQVRQHLDLYLQINSKQIITHHHQMSLRTSSISFYVIRNFVLHCLMHIKTTSFLEVSTHL